MNVVALFWSKNHYCHHVVSVAVHKKQAKFKDIHKQIPIGQTRPRGQPKKTTSALNHQLSEQLTTDSSSESSSDSSEEEVTIKPTHQVKRKNGALANKKSAKRGPGRPAKP